MKQLIVLCAVFILIAALLIQVPLEMVNYDKRHAVMYYVNNTKEMAKQEGYYTDEMLSDLKKDIAKKMNVNENEIIIDEKTTRTPKYRAQSYDEREVIYLKVSIPFKNIIAASEFYEIENNKKYYIIEQITTSEKLRDS